MLPLAAVVTACNDSYLERFPETSITEKVYFQNVNDLETYTNGYYGVFGASYEDNVSDNVLYKESSSRLSLLLGEYRDATDFGGWSWTGIRGINFMLNRLDNVTGDPGDIAHYVGLARLIRAAYYVDKVKTYSDVPWYDRDLQTTDVEELYKPQDSREFVVNKIFEDLDYATENMREGESKTKIMRQAALAFKARTALYEGTFRKYHPELGLNDCDRFLQIAADCANELMSMGYSLSTVSYDGLEPYESLFVSLDLTTNPEMIMVADYDKTLGRLHNAQVVYAYHGLSRSLIEDYLVIGEDGKTRTFQSIPGHETMPYPEVLENRDPRLRQTVQWPGFQRANSSTAARPDVTVGGYTQIKFFPRTYDQIGWGNCYTDLPIFRYGEILLIYAEAKAEMGKLTQDDVDRSINLLRQRVGMPTVQLSDWLANIDPVQEARYSNVSSSQRGAVLEVRRERRIELACEGFRYGDLMRWGCGTVLNPCTEGMYIPGPGMYDFTGDGIPDIGFVVDEEHSDIISEEDRAKYKLNVYTLKGNTFALTEGDHGYIYLVAQKDKFNFIEPKYYYNPVSQTDLNLNPNLVQNPFWKN